MRPRRSRLRTTSITRPSESRRVSIVNARHMSCRLENFSSRVGDKYILVLVLVMVRNHSQFPTGGLMTGALNIHGFCFVLINLIITKEPAAVAEYCPTRRSIHTR